MASAPSIPVQLPDFHDLPVDLDDLASRFRDVTSNATEQARSMTNKARKVAAKNQKKAQKKAQELTGRGQKRSLPRLAWPVIALVAGIGLYVGVRSRRSTSADSAPSEPSGAYARS